MRIALFGDLHGNMVAVEAFHQDVKARHVDALYCLGDLVGKGPRSPETMDWALAHCDIVLQGNWDEMVCDESVISTGGPWLREQLGAGRVRRLSTLPFEHRFSFAGRHVRLIHGRPIVPTTVFSFMPLEDRARLFASGDHQPDMVGFSDIHRPFYQHIDQCGILFNTGSIGNPLARQPQISYVILEGEMGETFGPLTHTFVQLPYDREEAVRQAEAVPGLPFAEAFINEIRTGRYSR